MLISVVPDVCRLPGTIGMKQYIPDNEIDLLCDQYEEELQDGKNPSIRLYLDRIDKSRQPILLYWLVTVDLQFSSKASQPQLEKVDGLRRTFFQYRDVVDEAASACGVTENGLPTIPGYRIKRHVKSGGQAAVFHATQNRTGQDVAIKLVSAGSLDAISESHRIRVVSRLENEIRTVAGLNHPSIVKIFDAGECEAGFFYVMQWVDGGSLADRRTISQVDAAKVIRAVAAALAEAHISGVLHLDVKPHNILIDANTGQPLLADFGLARLESEVTESTAIAGTLGYMAPEQAKGELLDTRTDVYGLGATFYELLTGQKIFQAVSLPYDESERDAWIPKSPRELRSDINPELDRICTTCLHFDSEARYQNCYEVAAALDRFSLTEDGRHIARIGARTLVASPLFFITNLFVMLQIHYGWMNQGIHEAVIWITMFSMYAVVFFVIGSGSRFDRYSSEYLAVESLWAVWVAKFFAAMVIAISLRLMSESQQTILMCYPMFSALTGLVLATMAPRYWRGLYVFAAVAWATALVLMWTIMENLIVAPAVYGGLATILTIIWGMKLRQLSREQKAPLVDSEPATTIAISARSQ